LNIKSLRVAFCAVVLILIAACGRDIAIGDSGWRQAVTIKNTTASRAVIFEGPIRDDLTPPPASSIAFPTIAPTGDLQPNQSVSVDLHDVMGTNRTRRVLAYDRNKQLVYCKVYLISASSPAVIEIDVAAATLGC
jgi:hypothetical protein